MRTFKFTVSDEDVKLLEVHAKEAGMSVQDFIRKNLFNTETIYTVGEAVRRALQVEDGAIFTLPSLYTDKPLKDVYAGVFAREFKDHILSGAEPQIKVFENSPSNSLWTVYILNKTMVK